LACEIKGLQETTLIDWPGRLCSTIFLPYCNFRCPFCHAKQLVLEPETLETIPVETVLETVVRLEGWLDGVVICGGEPTLHEGLGDLIRALRGAGAAVKLDTNGSQPEALRGLLDEGLLDFVAMDVKAPLDDRYRRATGVNCDLEALRSSIRLIIDSGVDYEFRTTMCPEFVTPGDVVEIAQTLTGAKRLALQQFRPDNCLDPTLEELKPYPPDVLNEAARAAAPHVRKCIVR